MFSKPRAVGVTEKLKKIELHRAKMKQSSVPYVRSKNHNDICNKANYYKSSPTTHCYSTVRRMVHAVCLDKDSNF